MGFKASRGFLGGPREVLEGPRRPTERTRRPRGDTWLPKKFTIKCVQKLRAIKRKRL